MTKKSFLHLLAKEISGAISTDEKKMLDESREENPTLDRVYTEMQRFMQTEHHQPVVDVEGKLDEVWRRIHTQPVPEVRVTSQRIVPLWARVAAAAAIVAGLVVLAYNHLPDERRLYTQTVQAGDENLYAVLGDGTQVWLSKNSQLAYNKNFGEKKRKIRLTGEAFFDVAHRPEVPLTVSANEVDVTVKGTAFNVNATQPDVEVALLLLISAGLHAQSRSISLTAKNAPVKEALAEIERKSGGYIKVWDKVMHPPPTDVQRIEGEAVRIKRPPLTQ